MRPHKQNPAQHRHASWAFQRELCTPQEIQRLTPLGDTVINAERALSQNPDSSVRDPGPNAISWTQYDVRARIARPATLNASSNAQSVSDEEEQDEEAEKDEAEDDDDGKSSYSATSAPTGPRIAWTKEMNFAVAIAAEHQKFPHGTNETVTHWPAVLLVINQVFQRFPDFVRDFPQGLSTPAKLRSSFTDRRRPHPQKPTELAKKNWAFQRASCSTQEQQAMAAAANEVINAERMLSATQNSIVRGPGVNAIRWIEYDVKAADPLKTKGTKRASSDAQPDAPVKVARRRRAAKTPAVEEEEEEQNTQRDQTSGSPAPPVFHGRMLADETPAEANRRHQAAMGRVRGGARPVEHAANDSFSSAPGNRTLRGTSAARGDRLVEQRVDDDSIGGDAGAGARDNAEAQYTYTNDHDSFLGPPNHSITTGYSNVQGAASAPANSMSSLDTFARVLLILEADGKLPMMHTSRVDFTGINSMGGHPVVMVREPSPTIADLEAELNMSGHSDLGFEEGNTAASYQGPVDVEFVVGFVSQNTRVYSLAGQVRRVEFCDATANRHKLVDVMLCTPSTCGVCYGGVLSSATLLYCPRQDEHPMVREQDIKQLEGHGWCFLPVSPEDLTLEGSHRSTGRVLEVIFSGGRRVIVEVYHQPADLSDPHFFNAFGHYT
jgi:hypothetical protein